MKKYYAQMGFTTFEVIISIALLVIMFGVSMPIYETVQYGNEIDLSVAQIVQGTREAQAWSMAGYHDDGWGVYIEEGSMTVFKGAAYGSRDDSYDQVMSLSEFLIPTGLTEIAFSRRTGLPASTGMIVLDADNGFHEEITITSQGVLEF